MDWKAGLAEDSGLENGIARHSAGLRAVTTVLREVLLCAAGIAVWVSLAPVAVSAAPEAAGAVPSPSGQVLLGPVIMDPCLGTRWQRIANSQHPGGPARMVIVSMSEVLASGHPGAAESRTPAAPPMVIHAGDRLLVEQKSPVLEAHLAAVALEPAALGQLLRVRLRAGANAEAGTNGPVIQVEAAGPGLARWNAGVSR